MSDSTLLVQYGDYAEAWDRFEAGGGETFRDQRKSVDFVRDRAAMRPITVACVSSEPYDRTLGAGLRAVGLTEAEFFAPASDRRLLTLAAPSRIVLRCPHIPMLRAAAAAGIPTFACLADHIRPVVLADLVQREGPRRLRRNLWLRRLLADGSVTAVANHGRKAALSLERVLAVPRSRILLHEHDPIPVDPPHRPGGPREGLLYVGSLIEAKGAGDLLRALTRPAAAATRLRVVGDGRDRAAFEAEARAAGLRHRVDFLGRLPGDAVRAEMRQARALVVPSRHGYDEGMPNVVAEALASRTPLLLSDHPAFAELFGDGETAVIFRASDPDDLARAIGRLDADPALADRLAAASDEALATIHAGHPVFQLLDAFLQDDRNATGWVERLSLAGEGARWV